MTTQSRAARHGRYLAGWFAAIAISVVVTTACASDGGTASDSDRRSASRCNRPRANGRTEATLSSGGVPRRFLVYVPSSYDGTERMPLVVALHGSLLTADAQLEMSDLEQTAGTGGFLVVAPQAANEPPEWNIPGVPSFTGEVLEGAPDDIRFIGDLLDRLIKQFCVDDRRIYATGYSGGARFASQLACDLADRIAAIAPVAGIRYPDDCEATRPVPVIAFHGTADTQNPYEGGGPEYWGYGVQEAVGRWVHHNRCTSESVRPHAPAVTVQEWDKCASNSNVVLFAIDGGGHLWPKKGGGAESGGEGVDASGELWKFFTKHSLPARDE
jgi:polyhydroxybutyrate depolymerase